ncbi:MAG: maltose alpha-D-glucosyltransferase [Actinomycetota bacterium]|nr:maltose alpha-D-glucosyltransferase [Actinomycetota bacterium]
MEAPRARTEPAPSLWYKDAVVYELHVRAFHDSNADGIGDLKGLIQKLDYIQDLGVTAVWLLPFYPSPLRDDGYDIAAYKQIHPQYGTLRDFRQLLREAHRRGLRVITELVLNHTSDQHPWFQRARRSKPGSPARDFYMWSDSPDRYGDARIIFKDFESSNWAWDPVAQQYYWHRFYSHQPDLNFDNPEVRRAMFEVVDFWMEMGVDGMRLDAVPYLFEREGTNCENLPETLGFLRELRAHVDHRFDDRMLLAEANQWPEDAVAYFGDGDVCHMAFHFPLMPRMFMATRMEDRFPIIDIMSQTPQVPEVAQWALFLRNHDELTLEMVTDEERDYMYRVYAQDPQARINLGIRRRLAPLLGNDRRLIEMMNGLLFSMPGTPVVYYGDELGMGDNIYLGDRNGVRTPMQWSADRNGGFSKANPQRLYAPVIIDPEYHAESINVESQQANPNSLLWWTKRMVALRKRYQAFGRGSLEFLYPENRKVLTYLRSFGDERILVVVNLSRHAQYVELDLSQYREMVPVELFGGTEFPKIGELPYFLTLSPHGFYWFALQAQPEEVRAGEPWDPPTITVNGPWQRVFTGRARNQLETALPRYLPTRRWFGGKARRVKHAHIVETIPVPTGDAGGEACVAMVQVEYAEGDPESYVLPIAAQPIEPGAEIHELSAITRLSTPEGDVVLFDAIFDRDFSMALLDAIVRRRRIAGSEGRLAALPGRSLRRIVREAGAALEPQVVQAEQSNTSIVYGDKLILKLFRRLEEGLNPDLEIGAFLTERVGFDAIPPATGALEYVGGSREPLTLGILQGYVQNEGDAWKYTHDALEDFVEQALARPDTHPPIPDRMRPVDLMSLRPPDLAFETIGAYLESARLLGKRTAELHVALASDADDPAFAPEPFTPFKRRSTYQSMRTMTRQVFRTLRGRLARMPQAAEIADKEDEILKRFERLLHERITATLIRTHGDYHLGQVLWTGKDFVIIDFEGEPARPVSQRRLKRSAMRDVAGMLRSYHYAALSLLHGPPGGVRPEHPERLEPWLRFWNAWVQAAFLGSYLENADGSSFVPADRTELAVLLDSFLLEKAVYELSYEVNNRPDWVAIPMQGILQLLSG